MAKFIELTLYKSGEKFLVAPDNLLAVIPGEDCSYIDFALPLRHKGSLGYQVREGYEQIKCMLNGVFEGLE